MMRKFTNKFFKPSTLSIYKRVLEIGAERIKEGTTYHQLKETLIAERYIKHGEQDKFLRHWLETSFYDCKSTCGNSQIETDHQNYHIENCLWVLKTESCISLLEYRQTAKNSWFYIFFVSVISLISVVSVYFDTLERIENLPIGTANKIARIFHIQSKTPTTIQVQPMEIQPKPKGKH